ncbi:hypothetical protein A7U60_g5280 [Sanghuangporus baumii]|uniref:DUF6534 domain-containing protein n=1 Tax=Sanghuangporus baumii TaxID=108892 RepID=A0A9Q5HXK1_SANBA|nr:hypothetical protein A7U60_g5280 [Sanghuangporus baumii]
MADCEPIQVDLAPTFGIQFWGLLVSIFFLGASLVQAYLYYTNNPDGWFMRTFVAVILVLDVAGTILVSDAMHYYLEAASSYNSSRSQHFYASRVLTAGKSNRYGRIAAVIIVSRPCLMAFIDMIFTINLLPSKSVGSFASFGSALAACIKLYLTGRGFTSLEQPNYKSLISAWSFSNGLCDAIATFAMCYFLTSYKSSFKSSVQLRDITESIAKLTCWFSQRTTSVVNSLFLFSINRGFLVFVTQIGLVTAYLAAPSKGYWTPFHLVLPKLHVNTLLAMLNSRTGLLDRMKGRWRTTTTTVQSAGGLKSDSKVRADSPNLSATRKLTVSRKFHAQNLADVPVHNGVHVTRSFMTYTDDDRGTSEVADSVKGHAIA